MNQILIPQYHDLVLATGTPCIIRPVPPHPQSKERPWILPIQAMQTSEGIFALPATFSCRKPMSLLEHARAFLAVNYPQSLRGELSPQGILLEPLIVALAWVITQCESGPCYRLTLENAEVDNSMGLQIYKAARARKNLPNASDPHRGAFLQIDRGGCHRLPNKDSVISELVSAMTETERKRWRPLEEVVKIITPAEERRLLKKILSWEMLIAFQSYLVAVGPTESPSHHPVSNIIR